MYQSKRHEPGGYTVFATRGEDAMLKLSLTTRLREAVQQEPWVLHWQPIMELATGRIVSVEGLIRWPDPAGGLTAPGEFIPLAEELGLIEAIGDWVLGEVGRQRAAWEAEGLDLPVGFNLSPRQLWSAHLAEKIMASVRAAGVDPHDVTVEITESTAMADPDRTQKVLTDLHAWGFELALDDFGTGYSSLARLKHMPVDVLKIDRSFIRDVNRDASLASMVKAMIQLAEGLGMTPLAEGSRPPRSWPSSSSTGARSGRGSCSRARCRPTRSPRWSRDPRCCLRAACRPGRCPAPTGTRRPPTRRDPRRTPAPASGRRRAREAAGGNRRCARTRACGASVG